MIVDSGITFRVSELQSETLHHYNHWKEMGIDIIKIIHKTHIFFQLKYWKIVLILILLTSYFTKRIQFINDILKNCKLSYNRLNIYTVNKYSFNNYIIFNFFFFYSDEVLLQWLETLEIYGISIIKCCGLEQNQIKELGERVAFLKKTQYG